MFQKQSGSDSMIYKPYLKMTIAMKVCVTVCRHPLPKVALLASCAPGITSLLTKSCPNSQRKEMGFCCRRLWMEADDTKFYVVLYPLMAQFRSQCLLEVSLCDQILMVLYTAVNIMIQL